MTNAELLAFLLGESTDKTAETLTSWLSQSRRFQAFVVENRAKIRKKLRTSATSDNLHSLLLELDIARYFLEDRRCEVAYEKFGQGRERTPDLTVTFRTHTHLNLEATRIQRAEGEAEGQAEKLIRIVGFKLGQMAPEMLNLLVLSAANGSLIQEEVSAAMKLLKLRVEKQDTQLLSRLGFSSPASFFKQFQWLNGIVLWHPQEHPERPPLLAWTNPQAKSCLPAGIRALLTSTRRFL